MEWKQPVSEVVNIIVLIARALPIVRLNRMWRNENMEVERTTQTATVIDKAVDESMPMSNSKP